jgi:hypothetical protein
MEGGGMHRSGRSSQSDEEGSAPMMESNIEQDEAKVGHVLNSSTGEDNVVGGVPNSSTGDGVPKKRRAKRTAGTSQRSYHVLAREKNMVSHLSDVCA